MSNNEAASVYIDIRARLDKLDADLAKGDAKVRAHAAKISKSVAASSKISESSLAQGNAAIKKWLEKEVRDHEAATKAKQRIETDFLNWKSREADREYAIAKRNLDRITRANADAAKAAQKAAQSPVSFKGANVPFLKFANNDAGAEAKKYAGMALLATGATLALGAAIFKLARDYADYGSELYRAAQQTGVSIKDLSGLKVAAQETGVEFPKLVKGIQFLDKQIDASSSSTEKYKQTFGRLGVEIFSAPGKVRPTIAILGDLADKFQKDADGAAKTALASKLFGRLAGPELIPLLNLGAGGIEALTDRAKQLGLVFDEKSGAAAQRFKKQLRDTELATQGLKLQLGEALIPTVEQLLKVVTPLAMKLADVVKESPAAASEIANLAVGFGTLTAAIYLTNAALSAFGVKAAGLPGLVGVVLAGIAMSKMAAESNQEKAKVIKDKAGKDVGVSFGGGAFKFKDEEDKKKLLGLIQPINEEKPLPGGVSKYLMGGSAINSVMAAKRGERIKELQDYLLESRGIPEEAKDVIEPGAGKTKEAKDHVKAVLEAVKNLQSSYAEEELRRAKAAHDTRTAELRASLAENQIAYSTYVADTLQASTDLYQAEKKNLDRRIAAQKSAAADIQGLHGLTDKQISNVLATPEGEARMKAIGALNKQQQEDLSKILPLMGEIAKLEGERATIRAELDRIETELGKGVIDTARQYKEFIDGQINSLLALGSIQDQFAEKSRKIDEEKEKAHRRFGKEILARGGGDIGSTREVDDVADLKHRINDADKAGAIAQQQRNQLAIEEKSIQAGVTLGVYSQLQARDRILEMQRASRPMVEAELDAYRREAAQIEAMGKSIPESVTEKIRELDVELQTLGVDLEKTAELGRILHQTDILPEHLNDGVRKFLSDVTSMQDSLENLRTNSVKGAFSVIDQQIDKISAKMGPMKSLFESTLGQFMKEQAHLRMAQVFEKVFHLKTPKTPQAATAENTTTMHTLTSSNINLTRAVDSLTAMLSGASGGNAGPGAGSSSRVSAGTTLGGPTTVGGVPVTSFSGGSKTAAGISAATSPVAMGLWKKVAQKFGLGGGSKSGGDQQYNADSGDPDGTSGASEIGGKGAAAAGIMAMAAGALNSGGKLGAVESGLMTAGEMFGPTPIGLALMGASIGLGLQAKIFGWGKGDEAKLRDAILAKWHIKINKGSQGDKVLTDLKGIGEQAYGQGKVKDHIQDILSIPSAKQEVEAYAEQTGQFDNILVKTAQAVDPNNSQNRIVRAANGARAFAGVPMIVGDGGRSEVFVPPIDGRILPNAASYISEQRRMQASMPLPGYGGGSSGGGSDMQMMHMHFGAMTEEIREMRLHIASLTHKGAGALMTDGRRQNPSAFSTGTADGFSADPEARRDYNKRNRY